MHCADRGEMIEATPRRYTMPNHRRTISLTAAVSSAVLLTGLGDAETGDARDTSEPVVLTFSNPYDSHHFPSGTDRYFDEVERLSGGTVSIELGSFERDGDPQAEQTMLDDVRDGVVDVAILAPQFFSTIGIDRVAALAPPMLIDSYDLQREVFTRGLPDRLLGGLDDLGVVGVAVLPGPLQKVVGFDRTFRTLDDFDRTVVSAGVGMGEDVVSALGATSQPWVGGSPFTGFGGVVFTVGGMWGRHAELEAEAATGNLNLFAVPRIVIFNPDTFASLDADQQAAFRDAGPVAVDAVIESAIAGQADALASLCAGGLEFVTMDVDDLAAIRAALEPVYTDLTADPEVAAYVDEVEQLKSELGIEPDSATCPEADTP
jgi:TRAP-type C4-dicarboxylate transport system substrate-binding protein